MVKVMWRFTRIFVLILVLIDVLLAESEPTANTKWGKLQGKWSKSFHGRLVENFLGIPYALPPVGDLRFKSPQPWNRTWATVRDATVDGPKCVQFETFVKNDNISGNEDCLYLNIFVPRIDKNKLESANLSVLVYVHGGGYLVGSSDSKEFAPEYLMDQDIILVTLNYRLNILGFYSTTNKASPGNYGLKDIVVALKWIQENIENFNGNPKSVTIMGLSAGSAAVHFLGISKKTEGLFDRYILKSGFASSPWSLHPSRTYRRTCLEVARLVGCLPAKNPSNDSIAENPDDGGNNGDFSNAVSYQDQNLEEDEEMMKCMRTVDAKKLLQTYTNFLVWVTHPGCLFGPTLEEDSEDAIVTMHPIKILKEGLFRDIPAIMQVVKDEGLLKTIDLHVNRSMENELVENFERYLLYYVEYHEVISDKNIFTAAIKDFYFNGDVSSGHIGNITEMVGDAMFYWPMLQALEYQSQLGYSKIYFSLFAYEGTFSTTLLRDATKYYGVAHADDENYLFPTLNYQLRHSPLRNSENDNITVSIMTEMCANFMKERVPKAEMVSEWPDYGENQKFLKIGNQKETNVTVEGEFLNDRMKFWKNLMTNLTMNRDIYTSHNDDAVENYLFTLIMFIL